MANLNWNGLPQEFTQYIDTFEKYGDIQFGHKIHEYLRNAPDTELLYLSKLKKNFDSQHDTLFEWVDAEGITENRAAALVYFTSLLLDIGYHHGYIV